MATYQIRHNGTLQGMIDGFREVSTIRTQEAARLIRLGNAPGGKQVYLYRVGQVVTASGAGAVKAGVKFAIEKRHKVNGYCRYYGAGLWHKHGDFM